MDPNANVEEQFRLIDRLQEGPSTAEDVGRLGELRDALMGWRMGGGFLPAHDAPTTLQTLVAIRAHDERMAAA